MQKSGEVLIIDDNPADIVLMKAALRACGFAGHVLTAKDGSTGIDLLLRRTEKPDLILLDLNMPVLDGHGMLERLRNSADERARALPVVMMTSSTLKSDMDRAHELGANGYMTKPADYVGLLAAVGRILNTFLAASRTPCSRRD